jgi:polysaccharide biosynthesis protein PslG
MARLAPIALAALVLWAPPAAHADDLFGMNVGGVFDDGVFLTPTSESHLREVSDSGLRSGRADALWFFAEPNPPVGGVHHYRWWPLDHVEEALAEHGIRWLPVLAYGPAWARTTPALDHSAPRGAADYAAYAGAFARRYGSSGSFWRKHKKLPRLPVTTYEIWNEPNFDGFWSPAADPVAYAALYAGARSAIHRADPSARVLVGGLIPMGANEFLEAMYAARPDLRGNVDGVAYHPYAGTVKSQLSLIRGMNRTLADLGDADVPLHVTEVGWPTQGTDALTTDPLPDSTRGANLTLLADVLAASDCDVEQFVPYAWVTPEANAASGEDWLGIYHPTLAPSETSEALAADVARHSAATAASDDAPLRVCDTSERSETEPLHLRLSLYAGEPGCFEARVSYRGRPLNGVSVRFELDRRRRATTDSHGLASFCPDRGSDGRLEAYAYVPRAAESRTASIRVR